MSRKTKTAIVLVTCIVLSVAVGIVVPHVLAQENPPEEFPPVPDVDTGGIAGYVSAVGLGAVIMVVVEILKHLKVLQDGTAGRWATLANIVAFAGLSVAGVFGIDYTGDQAQAVFDLAHRLGQAVLTVISSPLLFEFLRDRGILTPAHPVAAK